MHERRAPALLENLAQALLMAPLFVVLEVIFLLGGCAELEEEVSADAAARRKRMDAASKTS